MEQLGHWRAYRIGRALARTDSTGDGDGCVVQMADVTPTFIAAAGVIPRLQTGWDEFSACADRRGADASRVCLRVAQ